uniref:rRNA-processing protein UTP23 homolog n=1 Tax=Elaeophora elaphi TaxID=1147741 RepID=A0A0R3RSI5_9BILA
MPNERKLYKYATYLSNCSREAIDYGKCVGKKAGKVTHLACQREFTSLLNCVKKQVKRYKRAKRIISIYRLNFSLEPPYKVLLDGTFAVAALQNKINLREQMPKYLNAEVDIRVTNCVLKELEKLGSTLYGALHICKQFDVESCPHQPIRTAVECIKHMARRMKHKITCFFATQDNELTEALKQIPGIPILFIKYNSILIDRPSQATIQEIEKPKDQLLEVNELKKAVFGEDEKPRRKRKGPKGPNPLSVKKKKKKVQLTGIHQELGPNAEIAASKKRRRRRKQEKGSRYKPLLL